MEYSKIDKETPISGVSFFLKIACQDPDNLDWSALFLGFKIGLV